MKNDRLFRMVYTLLERGTVTAPTLAKEFEVSVRTIYRDVETLSLAGIPIYATSGKNGGIAILDGYVFNKTLFSENEQEQLLFAIQSLKAADQNITPLLEKLGTAFQKTPQNWIDVDFSRWGMGNTDKERFQLIKNAIIDKIVLKLNYCSSTGKITQRKIYPLKLIYKEKYWYLQGFCLTAKDFRLFKIGRIIDLEKTCETFINDFSDKLPPVETDNRPYAATHIKLLISKNIAFRVYDEFDRNSISLLPDGNFLVEIDFPIDNWVVNYLFSFGTDIEIIEPYSLKIMLSEHSKKIYKHYNP